MQSLDTPDLKSADFLADRYPTYRRLQKDFPLFDIEINGESCKVLTRYRDVDEVLRNPGHGATGAWGIPRTDRQGRRVALLP
ncbi:hypothetical protein WJ966_18200 [Achromobacter xylosoxidans]